MSGDPSNRFIRAVRKGDLETSMTLHANHRLSHNKVWSKSYNLLRRALQKKHKEVAEFLLTCGAKVNSKNMRQSFTPLHIAIKNGYVEVVDMLLNRNANVDVNDPSSGTPLYCAVQKKNFEIIKLLLKKKPQLDARSGLAGMTPLHLAVDLGAKKITELLVEHGFDVNAACTLPWKEGNTPLHYAAARGDEKIAEFLLNKGANVNTKAKDDFTPLHAATKMNREKVVRLLLSHGANVDAQNKNGHTALCLAVENENLPIIKLILESRPDPKNAANRNCFRTKIRSTYDATNEIIEALLRHGFAVDAEDAKDSELWHAAVRKGYLRIVKDLLTFGARVESAIDCGETLLHTAAKYKQIEVAKLLIDNNADINAKDESGITAIHHAVENVDLDMTELLLVKGAKVEGRPSLLHAAIKTLRKDIVQMIVDHEPSINVNANVRLIGTALYCAVVTDDNAWSARCGPVINSQNVQIAKRDIAKTLLARGARVNARSKGGLTVLHAAAERGYREVVKLLLEYNAKVDVVDKNKSTPLHLAAVAGNETVVKLLLDSGANIGAKDIDGRTALHIAVKHQYVLNGEVIKVLLKYGAEVGDRDRAGATALHIAATYGSNALELLLDDFDDIDCRDKDGRTPLHIASKYGQLEIVCELLSHDADVNVVCNAGKTPFDYVTFGMGEPRIIHDIFDDPGFDDDDVGIADPGFDDDDLGIADAAFDDNDVEIGAFGIARFENLFLDVDYDDYYHRDNSDYGMDYHDYFNFDEDDEEDDDTLFSESSNGEIAEILQRHMVKLRSLGRYLNSKNLRVLDLFWDRKYFGECSLQIKLMKTEKLGDSNVTLYDILTKGKNQLTLYARNKSIVIALQETADWAAINLYSELIDNRFKKAQKRSDLLDPSSKSLNSLFGYALPELATLELLNYLSNKDLKNLIEADSGDDS